MKHQSWACYTQNVTLRSFTLNNTNFNIKTKNRPFSFTCNWDKSQKCLILSLHKLTESLTTNEINSKTKNIQSLYSPSSVTKTQVQVWLLKLEKQILKWILKIYYYICRLWSMHYSSVSKDIYQYDEWNFKLLCSWI